MLAKLSILGLCRLLIKMDPYKLCFLLSAWHPGVLVLHLALLANRLLSLSLPLWAVDLAAFEVSEVTCFALALVNACTCRIVQAVNFKSTVSEGGLPLAVQKVLQLAPHPTLNSVWASAATFMGLSMHIINHHALSLPFMLPGSSVGLAEGG